MRRPLLTYKTLSIVYIVFILCTVLYNVIYDRANYLKDVKYQQRLDSLTQVIHLYERKQYELELEAIEFQKKVIILDQQIDSTNQALRNTRKYYEAKINAIDKYTASDLNEFFSTRYP
jgi:hypothetical protein